MHAVITVITTDDPAWFAFVERHPDATVFHHPGWSKALTDAYGYGSMVLASTNAAGHILAGLPVVLVRNGTAGSDLVSLPFTDYCPPLAADPESLARLGSGIQEWRRTARCRRLEVHGAMPTQAGLHPAQVAVRHILPLDRGRDGMLNVLRGTPTQRAINKAKRLGVEVRISHSRADLPAFYRLHWQTRRRLGVPVQPRRFFEAVWTRVIERDLGFVAIASRAGRPIAAALFLAWNHQLIYKFGASDHRQWELRPNNLLIWSAIEWACLRGYRLLDFGKTEIDNQGLRNFKDRWGSIESPLFYSYSSSQPRPASQTLPMAMASQLIRWSPAIVCRAAGELLYGRSA